MPIRINLLAEQQAAEDLRRRDPVKRTILVAGFLVGILVVMSAYLQFKLMALGHQVSRVESEWRKIEPDYSKVGTNLNKIADAERKWTSLQSLASNRFLWATPLNALQYSLVDDVSIVRLKGDQVYTVTEGIKPSTNAAGIESRGKPGRSHEKIALTLEANDYSANPGDQIPKLQETIKAYPYFKTNLQKVELASRSQKQPDPNRPGKTFVFFTLECQFPEKDR
ncbi:MAG TPA: hypothetical protein VFA77_10380 [Candidatus Eisenbacteria bacterium]|nr:hypothetical protein [Candidatus Eisenbacteria bacterium]